MGREGKASGVSAELEALYQAVSHELRSPLGAVLNYASILEIDFGPRLEPEARELLGRLRRSAENAVGLLDALPRMAMVERAALQPVPLDLAALCRAAFDSAKPVGARAELQLGSLPELRADPTLLSSALEELFSNALKFSGTREKAQVAVSGWQSDSGVVICVRDEGIGFDPRFASKLFQVFSRLHPRGTYPGAGVGLARVRRISERHGGRVWAESEPDAGARFFIELPARSEASE
ncbi:MAG TPA: ATP-binding protein [Myxococcota bacterium]|nr:ATP-binding protein [Myxococcota bacterium]